MDVEAYEYGSEVAGAIFGGVMIFWIFIVLAVLVFGIIVTWRIFEKAGQPGWAAIIPFYNAYILYKITWGNGWWFLMLFIPIVNVVFSIITMIKLSRAFGKSDGFAVGLIFLSIIFMAIIAFDKDRYLGPQTV